MKRKGQTRKPTTKQQASRMKASSRQKETAALNKASAPFAPQPFDTLDKFNKKDTNMKEEQDN